MQQGDYSSALYYQYPHLQNPNPNPNSIPSDPLPNPYASAPPFTSGHATSDYTPYASTYPTCPPNPDHISVPASASAIAAPTAPSYSPTSNPSLQSFNSSSQPSSSPPFESHLSYQPTAQQQSYYPSYDQHQTTSNYAPAPSSVPPNSNPTSSYSSLYSAPYSHPGSSVPPAYEGPYENPVKFEQGGAYFDDRYGSFNRSWSDLGSDLYGKRQDSGISRYDSGRDEVYGDGVYAYEGAKVEPYGARGTAAKSSTWSVFDDYGRSVSFSSPNESTLTSKIGKAVPKTDVQEDVKSGVQKFRVKLLAESGDQSTTDVLCQV